MFGLKDIVNEPHPIDGEIKEKYALKVVTGTY